MAYNNYIPGSYNYQPAPIGGYQQNGPAQYIPQVQPAVAYNPPTQSNGIIWVQGEEGAKAYMVASGNSVLLMDSEGSSFYIKSTDQSGMPQPLRVFDYVERSSQKLPRVENQSVTEVDMTQFVTREEFDSLKSQLAAIAAAAEKPQEKQQSEQQKNYNNNRK